MPRSLYLWQLSDFFLLPLLVCCLLCFILKVLGGLKLQLLSMASVWLYIYMDVADRHRDSCLASSFDHVVSNEESISSCKFVR